MLPAGLVRYQYTVINGQDHPIHRVAIGYDYPHRDNQLCVEPVGWDGDTIPSTSFEAPPGWEFAVIPTEEDSLFEVAWQGHAGLIQPGATVSEFSVLVDREDRSYEDGNWVAYLIGADVRYGALLVRR